MNTTVFKEILAFLFGRKYYANIVNWRGTSTQEISCFIFTTRSDAKKHERELEWNASFKFIETISFRSRKVCQDSTIKS